ncbi:MIP/aquaporin family protein [Spiroplasma endosymbiont of Apeira syringaria]|uniref:MIP/aquaporin family protein n=1 Tax=Spiroplasma endosymbiont of Apeira syringaria TaxID=3066307 RepID=UPI0030CB2409
MPEVSQVIIGELFGTFILILLGNCVVANVLLKKTKGENSGWLVICTGWGFAVAIAAMLSGISGAHLNPAVTIGLWVANKKTAFIGENFLYIPFYILFQFLGAMLGQLVVYLAYFKQYNITEDNNKILATFATAPAERNYIWNTITEIIGTFMLVMIVCATIGIKNLVINYKIFNSGSAFITGPATVGIGVMVIGLAIGGPTGFAINPARDLGPRIIHAILPIANKGSSDWKYAPVPVIGPILGAIIAGGLIQVIEIL